MASVDNYDVFINFRGADTRHGFTKILYDALVGEGIRVFLDNQELKYGKRLDEELPQAINNSKIYITVISETYASSKWCLRELAQIVRNKQQFKEKKEILPVFYKITPEDVKLMTNLFKNQLNCLNLSKKKSKINCLNLAKKKTKLNSIKENYVSAATVEEWADALKGIPKVRGWTVPIDGGYEQDAECCREIVKRASIMLRVKHKLLPKDLIGIENPIEEVVQLLDIRNPGLQIIGIHGMGGMGKTTLAKAVYNKLCDQFDRCCFLGDVRQSLDKDKGSRCCLKLQKKLLKEVSYHKDDDEITDVEDAVRRIRLTLEGKKVLMVFDDVSKPSQTARLIGNFGNINMLSGSCIIITTRDVRVFRNREFMGFTKIHEMKPMENEHALELFSWHAFGEPMPPVDYVELSKDAVSLTGRLPLSLEITGSLFFVGGRKNWNQTVEKLKNLHNKEVHERLKISYEDLEEQTREIFLDIACFFVDKEVSHETHMWGACDFYPELAIEELTSMCLIKMKDNGTYWMHDQIRDLGREIVRQEGPEYKEQRSRIWKKQDSIDILTSRKKENNIKGILLEHVELTDVDDEIWTMRADNFVNLNKVRLLHCDSIHVEVQIEGSFEHLLPNLRWLSLRWMRMERFNVTNLNLKKLVILNLSGSNITESWAGWKEFKDLPSLEVLNLSHCEGLKRTPDLSNCTSLKKLILSWCRNLEEIDPSIIYLKALTKLDLGYCFSLKGLPSDEQLEDSTRLQGLKLEIPNSIGVGLLNLEYLLLTHNRSLESLPNSITSIPKLRHLDLSWCGKLKKLPDSIGKLVELEVLLLVGCEGLVSLPNSLTILPKLHILNLFGCKSLESLPESVGEMVQLTQLNLSGSALKKLPVFISKQKRLELLRAHGTEEMQGNPTDIEELSSLIKLARLEKLSLLSCNHLQQLPAELPTSLVQLGVSSRSLHTIPDYSYLINLSDLELDLRKSGGDVRELQELNLSWIWRLSKLKKLYLRIGTYFTTTMQIEESSSVYHVSQLEELTLRCSVLGTCVIPSILSSALRRLNISLYRETTSLSLPRLNCLTHFILSGSVDLAQIQGLGELESLISFAVKGCNSLERLDDISKMRQLVTLDIFNCKKLRVISVVPCPPSLKKLDISKCESLESLVGSSESESQTESCMDDLHLVERLKIVSCPLLENKLPEELKRSMGRY